METSSSIASFKYSAFISYSHEDEAWAKWLQTALETYRVPSRLVGAQTEAGILPRRLAPVFRDRSDLPSATDLGAHINEALRSSANLIVICSPQASTSRWVDEEILAYRRLGRAQRIFCLIVAGEPNATGLRGREGEECFAPSLRAHAGMDQPGSQRFEPIAADVRPGGDGKFNAKLKLLSGLLGVGFDTLKQREHRRRYRRMVAVTSLAVVVTLMTTGLAVEATIAKKAAEQRQKEAENLVEFMLGDLNDKLRQVQRLDILQAVDAQAMAFFLALPARSASDQTLLLRAKALQKIGNVREDQGKLSEAMESYRGASALAAELLRRAPSDPQRAIAYAETLIHRGNAYWFQGDLASALDSFREAIALLERPTVAPTVGGLAPLSVARTNAGRVLEVQGDFDSAKALYERVLATRQDLSSRKPEDVSRQSDVADAYDSLGKIALEQGQLRAAIGAYRDVRQIRTQLLARTPDDRDLQESLLISNAILGRALSLCGADDAATFYVSEAVTRAKALMAFDANQVDWQLEFAEYSLLLGGFERSAGRFQQAAARNSDSLRVLSELVGTDRTNREWREELALARVESARLLLATGDPAQAKNLLDAALATFVTGREGRPADRTLRLREAQAHTVLGQVAARRNDLTAARDHWGRAREAIASTVRVGADPNVLAAWASAALLLGDEGAARPVVGELASMGYRARDFKALLAAKMQPGLGAPPQWCNTDEFAPTGRPEIR